MSRTWSRSSPQPKLNNTTTALPIPAKPISRDNGNNNNSNNNKCQECGCQCRSCLEENNKAGGNNGIDSLPPDDSTLHLHQEIEDLKGRLGEKEHQIVTMESQILVHANQYPHGEMAALRESLHSSADRYERLLENYRKLQKVNQGLEDKLLRIADKFEAEKISLTASVAELTSKLASAETQVVSLQAEAEQYKADCSLAIRSLQCRPASQFVSQRIESFPTDVQERVQAYLNYRKPAEANGKTSSNGAGKLIRVPVPTFPPTAVLYSLNKSDDDEQELWRSEGQQGNGSSADSSSSSFISAAIVAKILEEREKERAMLNGGGGGLHQDMSTQTGETAAMALKSSASAAEFYIDMDDQQHQHHQQQQQQTRSRTTRSPYNGSRSSGGSMMYHASANSFQSRPPSSSSSSSVRPRSTPMVNETIII